MRRASEHGALGVEQAFNVVSGTVEAACQLRHLIVALDLHADAEVSGTECLHPGLEPFEASCDPSHDGIGPQRNSDSQQPKRPQQTDGAGAMRWLPARDNDPSIWKRQRHPSSRTLCAHPAVAHTL